MPNEIVSIEFVPPIKGIMKGVAPDKLTQEYSEYMTNVRPVDLLNGRFRIAQRPGLARWGAGTQIGSAEQPVVAMCVVSAVV